MPIKPPTSIDAFLALDIRAGTILAAEPSKARKPSFKLRIDFGPEIGERTSSAAVREWYREEELIGRQVIAVVNFEPRQVANVISEVLCLGAVDTDGRVRLLAPDSGAANGDPIA